MQSEGTKAPFNEFSDQHTFVNEDLRALIVNYQILSVLKIYQFQYGYFTSIIIKIIKVLLW